ncbi:MAG TPA: FtsX-like permease family protein, partial [Bryobacteraceae bacterium]|nr:FtsX-like permease family protein [Bryobacteraceae bacterium]
APPFAVTLDASVFAFAIATAAFACIAFALAPALYGTRSTRTHARMQLRNFLLATQVAMSVVLLVGAGLLVASVRHARNQDPGFRIAGIAAISFDVPASSYDDKRSARFSSELTKDMQSVTGMQFAIADREPLPRSHWYDRFRLPAETEEQSHSIEMHAISPGYFDLLGVPIVAGRDVQPGDAALHSIVVNQAMARQYFDGRNPLGQSIFIGKQSWQIAGVSRDAYLTYLDGVAPQIFEPLGGNVIPTLLVRADSPGALDLATGIAKRIDNQVLIQYKPLSDNLERTLAGSRTMAGLAATLGVFALILAVIGMSGVFAYAVQQRTKEIGIRMALGADSSQVIRLVLAGATRAALIGLGVGYLASMGAARLIADYLYGTSPYNPLAYFEVAAVLGAAALAAAYFPARRATRIDPLNALRVE